MVRLHRLLLHSLVNSLVIKLGAVLVSSLQRSQADAKVVHEPNSMC